MKWDSAQSLQVSLSTGMSSSLQQSETSNHCLSVWLSVWLTVCLSDWLLTHSHQGEDQCERQYKSIKIKTLTTLQYSGYLSFIRVVTLMKVRQVIWILIMSINTHNVHKQTKYSFLHLLLSLLRSEQSNCGSVLRFCVCVCVCVCVLEAAESVIVCQRSHRSIMGNVSLNNGLWQMVWGFGGLCAACNSSDISKLLSNIHSSVCWSWCLFTYQCCLR